MPMLPSRPTCGARAATFAVKFDVVMSYLTIHYAYIILYNNLIEKYIVRAMLHSFL